MNIILLGSPASGKGTQAELLAKKFNLFLLQTGNIAREIAKKEIRIKQIIDSGKLIPEEEMSMYVLDYLIRKKSDLGDILFEGFPRFISQYEALENFLRNKGDDIDLVLTLDVSKKVAVERISSRRVCKKCAETYNLVTNPPKSKVCDKCGGELYLRGDDNKESVAVRFDYYSANTKALIDYLDKKGKLVRVNGDRSIEAIQKDLVRIIKEVRGGQN